MPLQPGKNRAAQCKLSHEIHPVTPLARAILLLS